MTALTVIVAAAATYSLTLLVVCDKITDRPRQWLLTRISGHGYIGPVIGGYEAPGYGCRCGRRFGRIDETIDHVHDERGAIVDVIPMSKTAALLYLFRCQWCASAWVAAPVAWSAWCFGDRAWWFVPAAALAFRGFTGAAAQYANPRS